MRCPNYAAADRRVKEFEFLAKEIREVGSEIIGKGKPSSRTDRYHDRSAPRLHGGRNIAAVADFFSFGTNDLTQMTYGLSRDDSVKFLDDYLQRGIYKKDPFQELDPDGVGDLMRIGIERGRKGNKKIKIGICGEHGGDPASVKLCHRLGLDYVSCSPFRLPVARLAAAQAAIEGRKSKREFKDV